MVMAVDSTARLSAIHSSGNIGDAPALFLEGGAACGGHDDQPIRQRHRCRPPPRATCFYGSPASASARCWCCSALSSWLALANWVTQPSRDLQLRGNRPRPHRRRQVRPPQSCSTDRAADRINDPGARACAGNHRPCAHARGDRSGAQRHTECAGLASAQAWSEQELALSSADLRRPPRREWQAAPEWSPAAAGRIRIPSRSRNP